MLITAEDGPGGRVRTATADSPAEVNELKRRGELLTALRHPGLIESVSAGPGPTGGWHLAVRWVGPDLASLGVGRSPDEVAGLGIALAAFLGDLEALGWTHGAVRPEHVLLDPVGRPVMCGIGGMSSSPASVGALDDVAALKVMLLGLIPEGAGGREWRSLRRALGPGRTKRPGPAGRSGLSGASLAQRLAALPLTPTLLIPPPPGDIPLAGAEASADRRGLVSRSDRGARGGLKISNSLWSARELIRNPNGRRLPRGEGRGWRVGLLLVASLLVVVGVAAIWHRNPAAVATACPRADRGCLPLPTPGGVLTTSAGRFAVAAAGEVVVLGRWDCGPASLPAILQPAGGAVWVFDRWASPAGDVAGRPAGRVPGATSLAVMPGADGCDALEVMRHGEPPVRIQPRTASR